MAKGRGKLKGIPKIGDRTTIWIGTMLKEQFDNFLVATLASVMDGKFICSAICGNPVSQERSYNFDMAIASCRNK